MARFALHSAVIVVLTILTQIGGIAWLGALLFRRRWLAFVVIYLGLVVSATLLAPYFGRVQLSCGGNSVLKVQAWIYCLTNRTYVRPELKEVLDDLASAMDFHYPGTQTLVLDAGFPFFNDFPLLPHLSHDDGKKVDIAFYYQRDGAYERGAVRSPIGYFAFEQGSSNCPRAFPILRWNFEILQPLWRELELEPGRTAAAIHWLADDRRVEKIFLEPHLQNRLGLRLPKVRFQGCFAARHDDHIHIQIR